MLQYGEMVSWIEKNTALVLTVGPLVALIVCTALTWVAGVLSSMEKLTFPRAALVGLIETALITPPVGLNLFVVQSLRKGGSLNDVIIGSVPFVLAMFVMLGVLVAFPGLALWLPAQFG